MTLGMGELRQLCGFSSKSQISFDHQKRKDETSLPSEPAAAAFQKADIGVLSSFSMSNGKLKVRSEK